MGEILRERMGQILERVHQACLSCYGDRLVSLAVFGSVARGTMRPDSDIDLLIVAQGLPRGRLARVREFEQCVETAVAGVLNAARQQGIRTSLSPVFKMPEEVERGSLLFLDMTDQAVILHDQDGFLRGYLDALAGRLRAMGARRVPKGGGYYWLLKPDYKPGEDIVL